MRQRSPFLIRKMMPLITSRSSTLGTPVRQRKTRLDSAHLRLRQPEHITHGSAFLRCPESERRCPVNPLNRPEPRQSMRRTRTGCVPQGRIADCPNGSKTALLEVGVDHGRKRTKGGNDSLTMRAQHLP